MNELCTLADKINNKVTQYSTHFVLISPENKYEMKENFLDT